MSDITTEQSHQGWRAIVELDDGTFVTAYEETEASARTIAERWVKMWERYCGEGENDGHISKVGRATAHSRR